MSETEEIKVSTADEYRKKQTIETMLPSGVKFLLKRRLGYGDYIGLLNMLSKETGKPASLDLLDDASKDEKLLEKMIEYVVPKMCIMPKVSVIEDPEALHIQDLSFDDLMFINNNSMKVELGPEAMKALESFRNRKSGNQ